MGKFPSAGTVILLLAAFIFLAIAAGFVKGALQQRKINKEAAKQNRDEINKRKEAEKPHRKTHPEKKKPRVKRLGE